MGMTWDACDFSLCLYKDDSTNTFVNFVRNQYTFPWISEKNTPPTPASYGYDLHELWLTTHVLIIKVYIYQAGTLNKFGTFFHFLFTYGL